MAGPAGLNLKMPLAVPITTRTRPGRHWHGRPGGPAGPGPAGELEGGPDSDSESLAVEYNFNLKLGLNCQDINHCQWHRDSESTQGTGSISLQ